MEYTTNYQLNQWDAQDAIKRTDFNADNAKIDAALWELSAHQIRAAWGSYTGDGSTENTITLGFKPEFMIVTQMETGYNKSESYLFVMLGDYAKYNLCVAPYSVAETEYYKVIRSDTGVTIWRREEWDQTTCTMNVAGKNYCYFAVG